MTLLLRADVTPSHPFLPQARINRLGPTNACLPQYQTRWVVVRYISCRPVEFRLIRRLEGTAASNEGS